MRVHLNQALSHLLRANLSYHPSQEQEENESIMTEHEKLVLTTTSKGSDVLTGKNILLNNQTIKRYLRITQGLSQNKQKSY